MSVDNPQQKAALRQSRAARRVRELFPEGTRVTTGAATGTVVRHVPLTNAQGGYLTVQWDSGVVGRINPISVKALS